MVLKKVETPKKFLAPRKLLNNSVRMMELVSVHLQFRQ